MWTLIIDTINFGHIKENTVLISQYEKVAPKLSLKSKKTNQNQDFHSLKRFCDNHSPLEYTIEMK